MDKKPSFLPWFSEEAVVVFVGTWTGMQAGRSPGGDTEGEGWGTPTHHLWAIILAPETYTLETCIFVAICIFNKIPLSFLWC